MQAQSYIAHGHQRESRTRRNVGNVALIRFILRTKRFFHSLGAALEDFWIQIEAKCFLFLVGGVYLIVRLNSNLQA